MERNGELGFGAQLRLLPGFAEFIHDNHKDAFLTFSRKMLRDLDIPLLRQMTFAEGDALADKSSMELLEALRSHNPAQHIEKAVDRWRKNQFPHVTRNHFVVDDVTGIGHTRKLSFLEFLPLYTNDPKTIVDICAEIDLYILEYTSTTLHNFVGIIDDKIHEYVAHLERQTRELRESNASLEEFAYAASHDLKEPLRKISIFIKLLGESMDDAPERDKMYYERVLNAADRMTALIDDLLSLSLLSKETQPERYSLQRVLTDTLQVLDRKIEETGAKVKSTNLPEATIIPSQFGLLFQNLLSNSLKFTRPGVAPMINVSARTVAAEEALHTFGLEKIPSIEIVVEDNGIGFSNLHQEKIFAVFQRLHNHAQYEGTGIGLAICRRIAKNHNGVITGYGEPGKGATFRIVIPA